MVLQLQAIPPSQTGVLQKGLLTALNRNLWCAPFLEKLLANAQTVIDPCSFGTGAILVPFLHAAGSCSPTNLVILSACPFKFQHLVALPN